MQRFLEDVRRKAEQAADLLAQGEAQPSFDGALAEQVMSWTNRRAIHRQLEMEN